MPWNFLQFALLPYVSLQARIRAIDKYYKYAFDVAVVFAKKRDGFLRVINTRGGWNQPPCTNSLANAGLHCPFYATFLCDIDREYPALTNGAVLPRLEQQHGHICVPGHLGAEG